MNDQEDTAKSPKPKQQPIQPYQNLQISSPLKVAHWHENPFTPKLKKYDTPYQNKNRRTPQGWKTLLQQQQPEDSFQSCSDYQNDSVKSHISKTVPKQQDQPQLLIDNVTKRKPKSRGSLRMPIKPQHDQPITCNCRKSRCLKFYCDCFAKGQICGIGCNCLDCHNSQQYSEQRLITMKMMIQRNPHAFDPKVKKGIQQNRHAKGCNCRKSGCQKRYCECYQAGVICTAMCKCEQCKNKEGAIHPPRKRRR